MCNLLCIQGIKWQKPKAPICFVNYIATIRCKMKEGFIKRATAVGITQRERHVHKSCLRAYNFFARSNIQWSYSNLICKLPISGEWKQVDGLCAWKDWQSGKAEQDEQAGAEHALTSRFPSRNRKDSSVCNRFYATGIPFNK